jgi:hypothetical protein
MTELLKETELPNGFKYPDEFIWMLDLPITNLKPWIFHSGVGLKSRYEGIKKRYPKRSLIPFAFRQDCDEVACWDLEDNNKVKIIEDFTRANPNEDVIYDNFFQWLKQAIVDMIDFCKRDISK